MENFLIAFQSDEAAFLPFTNPEKAMKYAKQIAEEQLLQSKDESKKFASLLRINKAAWNFMEVMGSEKMEVEKFKQSLIDTVVSIVHNEEEMDLLLQHEIVLRLLANPKLNARATIAEALFNQYHYE